MRIDAALAACLALIVAAGCQENSRGDEPGSLVVTGVTAPQTGPREIDFAGAVSGTSQAEHQACEPAETGRERTFTMTATGKVTGRTYFLYLSVYRYAGPNAYEMRNAPSDPLSLMATPTVAPGYPGYLNFVPKYERGNAFGPDPRGGGRPLMAIDAGEQSGWFDVQMTSLNGGGQSAKLAVKGRFVCGPAFEI